MKLTPPRNPNYCATVVRVKTLKPLDGLDNLVAAPFFGYQALVSKDTQVGDIGILFTAETQLSEEYARLNNLHRHGNLNQDENSKGYLEDNRRVKAIKFRGHQSDALMMPISSLGYLPASFTELVLGLRDSEGATFDFVGENEICRKYERPTKGGGLGGARTQKSTRIDESVYLPRHFDTENFWKNLHRLNDGDQVVVTQKLHGSSLRVGRTLVKRKLSWLEKLAKKFRVSVSEFEYDYVYASRNVIKDANNPELKHFYDSDIWATTGKRLEGLLPKGTICYAEIVGWTDGNAPIQKGYTYGLAEGQRELYIYRITQINPDGYTVDLSWEQIKEFCENNGLKHVPEIYNNVSYYSLGQELITSLLDRNLSEDFDVLPVGKGLVDEGVCIRRDGLKPLILKAKSPIFLQHETKLLDNDTVDIESEES